MNSRPKKERTGLKAFSAMILSILQKEKSIEYTKVADIIMEMSEGTGDDKNVKRRVYDALNVMCAVDLVKKDRKMAYLADNRLCSCEVEIDKRLAKLGQSIVLAPKLRERVEEKRRILKETIKRKELLVKLIKRNKERQYLEEKEKLHLPFILVSTKKKSRIDCETNDKQSYFRFIFTSAYKIYEDVHILKQIFGETCKDKGPVGKAEAKENSSPLKNTYTDASLESTIQRRENKEKNSHEQNAASEVLLNVQKPSAEGQKSSSTINNHPISNNSSPMNIHSSHYSQPEAETETETERVPPGSPLGSSYIFTEDDDWLNLYNFLN